MCLVLVPVSVKATKQSKVCYNDLVSKIVCLSMTKHCLSDAAEAKSSPHIGSPSPSHAVITELPIELP